MYPEKDRERFVKRVVIVHVPVVLGQRWNRPVIGVPVILADQRPCDGQEGRVKRGLV